MKAEKQCCMAIHCKDCGSWSPQLWIWFSALYELFGKYCASCLLLRTFLYSSKKVKIINLIFLVKIRTCPETMSLFISLCMPREICLHFQKFIDTLKHILDELQSVYEFLKVEANFKKTKKQKTTESAQSLNQIQPMDG